MTCSRLPSEFHFFASFLYRVLVLRVSLTRHFDYSLPSLTVSMRHRVKIAFCFFMALQVLEDLIHHCLDDHDFKVNRPLPHQTSLCIFFSSAVVLLQVLMRRSPSPPHLHSATKSAAHPSATNRDIHTNQSRTKSCFTAL